MIVCVCVFDQPQNLKVLCCYYVCSDQPSNLNVLYSTGKMTAPKPSSSIRHIPSKPENVLDAPVVLDDYCRLICTLPVSRPVRLSVYHCVCVPDS